MFYFSHLHLSLADDNTTPLQARPNPGRLALPLSDTILFCRARVGNDCQHYRGSRVAYAASAELGDFRGLAMLRRLLAAARLRNRATMTRIEHLQAICFCPNVVISVLCVMKINLPHIPCFVRLF